MHYACDCVAGCLVFELLPLRHIFDIHGRYGSVVSCMESRHLNWLRTVLDEDVNGLIKVEDVNNFMSAKPEGITLMQWIAYSAYGMSSVLL